MVQVRNTAVAFLLLSGPLWAQNSNPRDQETIVLLVQQVKDLQLETRELREEVNRLEADRANVRSAAPDAETAASQPLRQATSDAVATEPSPVLSPALHDVRGIQWRGFGEVSYKVLDQRQPELGTYGFQPGSAGNFYTGDFGLFLSSRLTEKTSVAADVAFEEIDAQSYKLDMRQALLKYDMNEHLKISFGRYQTGIGYYNWAYRSAAWLQTSVDRPLIMEYASNGGLLPTQAVGVSLNGAIPSGKLRLNYIFQYGSGDTIRPDINRSGLLNDESDGNHVLVGFYIRPDWATGLQVGGSFFHDKISDSDVSLADRFGQSILNSYAVYIAHGFESLNEIFLIRHAQLSTNVIFNTPAFYSQISRRWGSVRPFFRYQYVSASGRNTIFDDVGERAGPSFGARYDLNDYIAFKMQLDHTLRRGLPNLNGLQLQTAFTF
jgi:hypothetical protein